MKNLALAAAVAVAAMAASSASAATFLDPWTVSAFGGISVVYGDNGLGIAGAESIPGESTSTHAYNSTTGDFTDTFSFMLPTGIVGFTLSSIGFAANSSLTVSSFKFNGANIGFTNSANSSGGFTLMGGGGPFPVIAGGPQTLTITGHGGAQAVLDGTATFERVAVVPEPATWALMIAGFGGAGAMIRRRRGLVAA